MDNTIAHQRENNLFVWWAFCLPQSKPQALRNPLEAIPMTKKRNVTKPFKAPVMHGTMTEVDMTSLFFSLMQMRDAIEANDMGEIKSCLSDLFHAVPNTANNHNARQRAYKLYEFRKKETALFCKIQQIIDELPEGEISPEKQAELEDLRSQVNRPYGRK